MTTLESLLALTGAAGIAEPVYLEPIPASVDLAARIAGPYMANPVGDFSKLQRKRYQVYARAKAQNDAEELAQKCYDALVDVVPAGGAEASEIQALQAPAHLGTDDNGRHEYVFNISVVCWPEKD